MLENHKFQVGDVVKMKKPHPCGSNEWLVERTGIDFGLKCCGCSHYVLIPRPKFLKAVRALVKESETISE